MLRVLAARNAVSSDSAVTHAHRDDDDDNKSRDDAREPDDDV